jgi:hypothetical protein
VEKKDGTADMEISRGRKGDSVSWGAAEAEVPGREKKDNQDNPHIASHIALSDIP